jgi:TonB-linked SusC/RagA family outer membrane protein
MMLYRALPLVAALIASLTLSRSTAAQATGNLRGTVTDSATGRGVPSARVIVPGTTRGVATDDQGRYTLSGLRPGPTTVSVQRIGYAAGSRSGTVIAGQTVTLDVTIRAVTVTLEQVVTVGYGTMSRQTLTSAIATIDSTSLANIPVAGIDNALQGKLAGVQVMQNSGEPGSGLSIRVRGPASLNAGNQPLYVVDGVPIIQGSLGQISLSGQDMTAVTGINPDEIASIDVLKDAAASAIYGSRGSNGVILITTKRGAAGRTRFALSAYGGSQGVEHTIGLLNATQYVALMNESAKNDGYAPSDYDFTPGVDDAQTYDWQGAVFRRAAISDASLSMSGGTERMKFYLSAGNFDQKGIVIGSDYSRQSGRVNLDIGATDRLVLTSSIGLTRENSARIPGDQSLDGVVTNAIGMQPMRPIAGNSFGFGGGGEGLRYSNPVAIATYNFDHFKTTRTVGNIDARFSLTDYAFLTGRVGADVYGIDELTWGSPKVDATYAATANGVGRTAHSSNTKYMTEGFITLQPSLPQAMSFAIVAGAGLEKNHRDLEFIRGEGFPTGFSTYIHNAANITSWDGSTTGNNLVSFFGRANWSLHDRYFLSASVRSDGSSRFGSENRYGLFPALSAGWLLSDEPFASGLSRFATVKLRGSYGVTGNQGIGDFASLSLGTGTPYSGTPGVAVSQLGNPGLRWEKTAETDLGLDLGFLGGRVSIIGDWYNRNTSDLLVQRPIPLTTGFSSIWDNIGAIRNRGIDLGLHTINLVGTPSGGLGWTSDLNVTWNKNEVTQLYQGQSQTYTVSSRVTSIVAVGQPIGEFYLYKFAGVDPANGNAQFYKADGTLTYSPTSADLTFAGSPQPKYYGGFTNALTFKSLDLRGFVQFSQGGKVFNMMRIFTDDGGYSYDNKSTVVMSRWQKPGDVTDEPRMSYDGTSGARLMSTRIVEDGSFVRLGEITLGYKLPGALIARTGMDNARLFVSGRNLKTWTKYTGYNPDVNSAGVGANVVMGVDYYAYPLARTFTLGLSAGW